MLQEDNKEEQDSDFMLDLSHDIRENIKLVNGLIVGIPVVAKIKERIQKLEDKIAGKNPE